MAAPHLKQQIQEVPLKLVGGNGFGRYPKISIEQTFNMLVSDDALVDYAGYKNVLELAPLAQGRANYASSIANLMFVIVGAQVYTVTPGLVKTFIGNLATSAGDVFISENNGGQIGITDGAHLYVYNYATPTTPLLLVSGADFMAGTFPIQTPGYISFQNGRLIIADLGTQAWYLSGFNDALQWDISPGTANHAYAGALQSKPDTIQAAVPTPGGGNNLVLFGHNVAEQWQDVGAALFPYQRSSTFNVDYGTANASSIASLESFIVWISTNEQSGPVVMICSGSNIESISTDGIDFKLSQLTNPQNCIGFLFKQDGHLIYQFTFPDDNLSYIYDFNTKLFFSVSDEDLNYHIARSVVFFNNKYYFVSLNDGNLYEFGTQFTNYNYGDDNIKEIPRIRICPPLRLPSQRMYILKSLGFTLENGRPNTITTVNYSAPGNNTQLATESGNIIATEGGDNIAAQSNPIGITNTYQLASEAVDLSLSRDGGETFGSSERQNMNPSGKRRSRFIYQRLGQANDITPQLRFHGFGRFVCFDGVTEVYQ